MAQNILGKDEVNTFQNAVEDYFKCYTNYYAVFNTIHDLQDELKRPDINFVCKKQLSALRSEGSKVGFKEIIGSSKPQYRQKLL